MDRDVDPKDFKDVKTVAKSVGKAFLLYALILVALFLIGR